MSEENGRLHIDLKTKYPLGDLDVTLVMNQPTPTSDLPPIKSKETPYDFSDLVGRLTWKGDAVLMQREIRDEWE